jgi:beta-lactamase superfamily II metal-dependent hydrolase
MERHKLPRNRIKALFITHKHLDHLRGAVEIMKRFEIDNFIINHDYQHSTKTVYDLLNSARSIPSWINCNKRGGYNEREVTICIRNPDSDTCNKTNAPDINDSSISLCLRHGKNLVYLTGDTGNTVIRDKFNCNRLSNHDNLLKVSHHGSCTGTNLQILSTLKPTHNFISAGVSNRYKHPDNEVVDMITNYSRTTNLAISNRIKQTVCYKITGEEIIDFRI